MQSTLFFVHVNKPQKEVARFEFDGSWSRTIEVRNFDIHFYIAEGENNLLFKYFIITTDQIKLDFTALKTWELY